MKHTQKMVMLPEHLMQSIETEHRLMAPSQLTTLTRLDQDVKQIMDSSFPEDQKVLLLDQLLQRYQGSTKEKKSEVAVKPAVVLPKSEPAPPTERTPDVNNLSSTSDVKSTKRVKPRKLPATPVTTKQSKIPVRSETPSPILPEDSAHAIMMETPPDSKLKTGKCRYKPRTPLVTRLQSKKQWEPY